MIAMPERGELHQLVFRWAPSDVSGPSGLRPVAWSCDEDSAYWANRFAGPALWAAERPALVRLLDEDRALLLRTTPRLDANRRSSSLVHALYGHRGDLPHKVSLGLHEWTWPGPGLDVATASGPLKTVTAKDLFSAGHKPYLRLRSTAMRLLAHVRVVVAQALRQPGCRVAIPDPGAGTDLAILLGAISVLNDVEPGEWSFASLARSDLAGVRIACLSELAPAELSAGDLTQVDPADRSGDRFIDLAGKLVELRFSGSGDYARLMAHVKGAAPGPDRIDRLSELVGGRDRQRSRRSRPALSVVDDPVADELLPRSGAPEEERGPVVVVLPGNATRRLIAAPSYVSDDLAPVMPLDRAGLPTVAEPDDSPPTEPEDDELIALLREEKDWAVARPLLAELASRSTRRTPEAADAVCRSALELRLLLRWPEASALALVRVFDGTVRPGLPRLTDVDGLVRTLTVGSDLRLLAALVADPLPFQLPEAAWRAIVAALVTQEPDEPPRFVPVPVPVPVPVLVLEPRRWLDLPLRIALVVLGLLLLAVIVSS